MARQAGERVFEGTIEGLIYYKSKHGFLVRRKGSLNKERVDKDPAFDGSRKAGTEFGKAAAASGVIRRAIKPVCPYGVDGDSHYRLTKVLRDILVLDTVHPKGERKILQENLELLKSFEWIPGFPLTKVMWGQLSGGMDENGVLTINLPGFSPKRDLNWPHNATHAEVTALAIKANFDEGVATPIAAKSGILPKAATPTDLALKCPDAFSDTDITMVGIGIGFFQEVGGKMTPLAEGNTFAIVS